MKSFFITAGHNVHKEPRSHPDNYRGIFSASRSDLPIAIGSASPCDRSDPASFESSKRIRSLFNLTIICCLASTIVCAQRITLNSGIDTVDLENKAVVELWNNYLKSDPDSLYDNPYWNTEEKRKYKSYDLLKSEGFVSPSLYYWAKSDQNIILSISKKGDHTVLQSMFYKPIDKGLITIMAIVNVVAMRENNKWVLYNYLPYHSKGWVNKKIGTISYVYHPHHDFNSKKAKSANEFLRNLSSIFDLKIAELTYYIAPDCDGLHHLKGFEYVFTMGALDVCGFYDEINHIIYSTSQGGESNQHEIVHVMNERFPNGHGLLLAGIAAYWGGENANFGKPLIYHLKRVNEYLVQHQEIDLNEFTEFYSMDSKTNPQYVIGAVICDEALKKGGIEKLKIMLNAGSTDEELIETIHKELGIAPTDLNSFFRSKISELAKMQSFIPIDLKSVQKK